MKKILAMLLALTMVFALCACGAAPAAAAAPDQVPAVKEPTDEEYAAWAESHGYVLNPEENGYAKLSPELATSATEMKQGGVNYGIIEWDAELQEAAIKEFLKGGTGKIVDPAWAQDDSGYNYRNMMQMATSFNNVPNCSNLELVLNIESMTLVGISEPGTSKINEFTANPSVSVAWSRQLHEADEAKGYNYFGSYGVTFYGDVKIYGAEDLETTEGQDALIKVFDTYYNTDKLFWGGYSATFAEATDDAAIREGKLTYITNLVASGRMIVYEIIPSRIVLTAPFLINMIPSYSNAQLYTTVQSGSDKYAYDLGLSDEFIDKLVEYKNEYMKDEANLKAAEEYYTTGMFTMLDPQCAQFNMPTSYEVFQLTDNAAGMKTQTTWTPAA